jgi:hypothetical protein
MSGAVMLVLPKLSGCKGGCINSPSSLSQYEVVGGHSWT